MSKHELINYYFGTPDVLAIYGSKIALENFTKNCFDNYHLLIKMKNNIKNRLIELFKKYNYKLIDLSKNNSVPHIQSFLLPSPLTGSDIQIQLSELGVCIGIGSACTNSSNGSHVMKALKYTDEESFRLIRISFSIEQENYVDFLITSFETVISKKIKHKIYRLEQS